VGLASAGDGGEGKGGRERFGVMKNLENSAHPSRKRGIDQGIVRGGTVASSAGEVPVKGGIYQGEEKKKKSSPGGCSRGPRVSKKNSAEGYLLRLYLPQVASERAIGKFATKLQDNEQIGRKRPSPIRGGGSGRRDTRPAPHSIERQPRPSDRNDE